ncbi:MAG: hypothetical protein V1798_08895 [Pseudomonadota bacterium]
MRNRELSFIGILVVVLAVLTAAIAVNYFDLGTGRLDGKNAVRMVERAALTGADLGVRLAKVLPPEHRLCEARILNRRRSWMEVTCTDTAQSGHVLKWRVGMKDGAVEPGNPATERFSKGGDPWSN